MSYETIDYHVLAKVLEKLPPQDAAKTIIAFGKDTVQYMAQKELPMLRRWYSNIYTMDQVLLVARGYLLSASIKPSVVDAFALTDDWDDEGALIPRYEIATPNMLNTRMTYKGNISPILCEIRMAYRGASVGEMYIRNNGTYQLMLSGEHRVCPTVIALFMGLACVMPHMVENDELNYRSLPTRIATPKEDLLPILRNAAEAAQAAIPEMENVVYHRAGEIRSVVERLERRLEPMKFS